MDKIIFDHTKEEIQQVLDISVERFEKLKHLSEVSMWELKHPDRDGFTSTDILEAFIKHAQTPQELALQAFIAGAYSQVEMEDEEAEMQE